MDSLGENQPPTFGAGECRLYAGYIRIQTSYDEHALLPGIMVRYSSFPNIRYSASEYAKSKGKDSEAAEYMKNGIKANKLSFLLHYQFAEHEEGHHRISEVRTTLESLIENVKQEYEKMNKMAEFMKMQINMEEEIDTKMMSSEMAEAETQAIVDRQRKRKGQLEIIDHEHAVRVGKIADESTNAWIALMQAIRRAEGIKAARQVFAKARKAKPLSHHVFVASGIFFLYVLTLAMMEFHSNDDKVIATKVFELGLKSYPDKSDFVLHYLNFLIQINDEPSIIPSEISNYRCTSVIRTDSVKIISPSRETIIRTILQVRM
jgi:cleavage stimulation factor subunit 3